MMPVFGHCPSYEEQAMNDGYQNQMVNQFNSMTLQKSFSQLWEQESVNLLSERNIKSKTRNILVQDDVKNCYRDVMRPTLRRVPETASLLQKCRLPFGLLIHPFRDDENMPVIQGRIVRCRSCRTYINPFVRLLDQTRWECNICHLGNDLPEDFFMNSGYNNYYGQQIYKPELNVGTVEFIAPIEYMVRPPQPAAYLFVFDCSAHAHHLGFLSVMADAIFHSLDSILGDSRTLIGFIGFDSNLHFFNLGDKQPQHLVMPDVTDVFLPAPENLLVRLQDKREVIENFLNKTLKYFPTMDNSGMLVDSGSALGPALKAAFQVLKAIGGRITVIQATLPSVGSPDDGSVLKNREDPNNRVSSADCIALTRLLNPSTDFYKSQALECVEHHIAVDLFNLSPTFSDLATISQIVKVSGGSLFYYGSTGANITTNHGRVLERFKIDFIHYLTRSIGFEAVMRLRCTKGLSIHTFHGNFFVRSTDLISLPNCNPDNGYAMQLSIDEDLKGYNSVCFQAAVLYTNPFGERRIRVHTLVLPIVATIHDVINYADQEAIVALLCKMAVDRSIFSKLSDAREALINSVLDLVCTYRNLRPNEMINGLITSQSTRLLPLYISALLKHIAFRIGISTKIDERVYAMERFKSIPICYIMKYIYPDLYPVHGEFSWEKGDWPQPVQLSFANVERNGVYLLDTYDCLYLYICKSVSYHWLNDVFGVTQWSKIPDDGDTGDVDTKINRAGNVRNDAAFTQTDSSIIPLKTFDNDTSKRLRAFIDYLLNERPLTPHFFLLREDSRLRYSFLQYMYDDRSESAFSYYEFLQHLQNQMKN